MLAENPQEIVQQPGRIISTVLHQIDVESKSSARIEISSANTDLESYLDDLLSEIHSKEQKRSYDFVRETTEFYNALSSYWGNQDLQANTVSTNLAERLLDKEVNADAKYGHLGASGAGHVKKGSYLQFLYRDADSISYLGVKIEHQTFLDEEDFRKKIGISIANKVYKACKVSFDTAGVPQSVFVYDTNTKPSVYWWSEFLELKEIRNDSHNTREASKSVLRVVDKLKKDHPADHTILRNSAISSFKQKGELKYDEFIRDTFENYEPEDPALVEKLPKIVEQLKKLPEKKDFDTRFNLVPSEVPFKKSTYKLSQEITLTIEDGIENIHDKVWSERAADGRHLVVIDSSEEEFNRFKEKVRS